MIEYPHFAVPGIRLVNGYIAHGSGEELAYEFEGEQTLETCVARILIRRPQRLRGKDLRFLRRMMDFTQAQFGERIDRDAQTVARIEKDAAHPVERNVDIIARLEFAARYDRELSAASLNQVESGNLYGAIGPYYLSFRNGVWSFEAPETGALRAQPLVAVAFGVSEVNLPQLFDMGAVVPKTYFYNTTFPVPEIQGARAFTWSPPVGSVDTGPEEAVTHQYFNVQTNNEYCITTRH